MTATFGKLEHQTLTLEPGLNIIDAPNEWGKSTWCAFMVAMLYGLDTRERSTKTSLADKERYAPWSGSPMSGRMELEWQGRRITIERRTKGRTPMGDFTAYETDSGLAVAELTAANCGQTLLGVERSVYTRTGFLRGADMPVTMNEELRGRLNGLVTTGEDSRRAEELGEKLRALKNRCRHNRTGLIPQAQSKQLQLEAQLREYEALEGQVRQLEAQCRALEERRVQPSELESAIRAEEAARLRCQELERQCAQLPDRETELNPFPEKNPRLTLYICGALSLLAGIGLLAVWWLPAALFGVLGLILIVSGLLIKPKAKQRQQVAIQWAALDQAREALRLAAERLAAVQAPVETERLSQLHLTLGQAQGRLAAIGDPEELRRELARTKVRIQELERTERALILAQEALTSAQAELQRRFAPGITRRARELFATLTAGRYDRLSFGQELSALAGAKGEDTLRGPLWYSEGTADQLYLALRLAVAEELTPDAPLILDDALIRFDDERLATALTIFEDMADSKQVVLFSCRRLSGTLQ